ncbi:prepilin peptidase [Mumia qirimensis]|uniref:prepilin peptidase n=1 Tax=Mumia qirimensis TaxID=3234852 RepID=UPI00351D6911
MPESLIAATLAAAVAALGGLLSPRLIGWLPEPDPEPAPPDELPADAPAHEAGERDTIDTTVPAPPKIPYADLAARPHLSAVLALAAALFAGSVGWRLGLDPALPLWVAFAVLGVVLSFVDWHTRLLPKRVVLPAYPALLALAGLAAALGDGNDVLVRVAIGWAAVSGVYALLWIVSPRGIGYGDVRFSGIVAIALATLGWAELLVGTYGGFVLGAVGGIVLVAMRLAERRSFPFGPFMVLGAWVGAIWGSALLGGWG